MDIIPKAWGPASLASWIQRLQKWIASAKRESTNGLLNLLIDGLFSEDYFS